MWNYSTVNDDELNRSLLSVLFAGTWTVNFTWKKSIEPVKLMAPNKLKLNPGDAEIIKERQNVFSKFGFKFSFDSNNDEVFLIESGKIGKHIMDESDIYE